MTGSRAENHDRMNSLILAEGRRQLGEVGPAQLSLRAVARQLGVASSAVYRYVKSRDELLTRLIIQAYDELADYVDASLPSDWPPKGGAARQGADAWRTAANRLRDWAKEHPHEWALLYGTPVPGYHAPANTIAAAARVPLALATIAQAAPVAPADLPAKLSEQLHHIAEELSLPLAEPALLLVINSWSAMLGTISLELFGHYVGSLDPTDDYWEWLISEQIARLGWA